MRSALYCVSFAKYKGAFLHLTENLRIEESELKKLDTLKICEYSVAYHSTNIKKLYSLLRRL